MMTQWTVVSFSGGAGEEGREKEQGFPEDGYYPGLLDASIRN